MRTFEVLGSGRKLITTNKNIIKEPFYDEEYIYVLDPQKPLINKKFFDNDYKNIPKVIDNYHIDNWVHNIFR